MGEVIITSGNETIHPIDIFGVCSAAGGGCAGDSRAAT